MISAISMKTDSVNPMSFIQASKIDDKELKMAEKVLAQAVSASGEIDYTKKTQKEVDEINEAAHLLISSMMPEAEGQTSFKMSMANVNPLYNENGLSSDPTQTAAFRQAEAKYSPSAKGAGVASDTRAVLGAVLDEIQNTTEGKVEEALQAALVERQEEQARLEAERVTSVEVSKTGEIVQENGTATEHFEDIAAFSTPKIDIPDVDIDVKPATSAPSNVKVSTSVGAVEVNLSSVPTTESIDIYV